VRRIDETIESLTPPKAASGASGSATGSVLGAPLAFRWRGRRYVVDSVLAHWVETGAWWRHTDRLDRTPSSAGLPPADPERWLWRVVVVSKTSQTGVFDLCLEPDSSRDPSPAPSPGRWSLHAIYH
jgi:hypothetical protein